MGIVITNKMLSETHVDCNGRFQVKLSLSATPDITSTPVDFALILDRSGSMGLEPLAELKKGVCQFIDTVDRESNRKSDGIIGGGSRIGIVSFSTTATIDQSLTTSAADLKTSVNALSSGGSTNHEDAFRKGMALLDTPSGNAKVMIIFTDGESSAGSEGFALAEAAKAKGITIYCIGYAEGNRINLPSLYKWSSSPSSAYTLIIPSLAEISDTFSGLVKNIGIAGATDIVLTDTVSDCFNIVSVDPPRKGKAMKLDGKSVKWEIPSIGTVATDSAELTFTVEHIGNCSGNIEVNTDIAYSDAESNKVSFPSPLINVNCVNPAIVEDCPASSDVRINGCADYVEYNAGDLALESLGRVLQVSATIRNVCPNKQVALAVILTEVDAAGNEESRGMKTMVIPAQTGTTCRDILIRCIKFVLPESLDTGGTPDSLCNDRNFRVRLIANYLDSDFYCCK